MWDKIKRHYQNGGISDVINSVYRRAIIKSAPILMRVFRLFMKNNRIVFSHFDGKAYGGNPGMICDYILEKGLPYELIWIMDEQYKQTLPEKVKRVPDYSMRELMALATAKIWIDDCRKPRFIRKGKKQYYIQTWHGGGPCLKKVEGDAANTLPSEYISDAIHDSEMADLFISECEWRTINYRKAFWYQGEVLCCGTPTSDVFLKDIAVVRQELSEKLPLKEGVNYVLYAPTFRDDNNTDCYRMNFMRVLEALSIRFGGEWAIIVRLHPKIMQMNKCIEYSQCVINGSLYPRLEDLLLISDMLITDYSGCMFQAYKQKKKVIVFASDLVEYTKKERDFYFDLKKMPASVAKNEEELIECIRSFDENKYEKRVSEFLGEIGYYRVTNATNAVVDRIESIIKTKK